jgi:hypothetical protein
MTTSGGAGPVTPWSIGVDIHVSDLAADRDANLLVAAAYGGALDLGLGPLPVPETDAALVAKYSPEGKILWTHVWMASGVQAVAADACGDIFVALTRVTTPAAGINPEKQTLTLAKLDSTGQPLWERSFHPEPIYGVSSLLVDARGDVAMSGYVTGLLELEGSAASTNDQDGNFVAVFSGATGHVRWSMATPGYGAVGIGLEASGDLFVSGDIARAGKAEILPFPSKDGSFPLLRLDASGAIKSITRTGASVPFDTNYARFAISPQGDVGVAGQCPVKNEQNQWCMIRFAADGSPGAQQILGKKNISKQEHARVAFDAERNLLMLSQTYDLKDPVTPYSEHLYLTTLAPSGAIVRANDWRSGGLVAPNALCVDPAGGVLIAARVDLIGSAAIDVGDGPRMPTIVARVAP